MIKDSILTLYYLFGLSIYKRRVKNLILNRKRKKDCVHVSLEANIRHSELESNIVVLGDAEIISSYIGRGTYVGSGCKIIKTQVGRFCSIGKNLQIIAGNHPTSKFVSSHPMFYLSNNLTISKMGLNVLRKSIYSEYLYAINERYVVVGNDVWVGQNVSIMNGVKIGDGAIIASGTIVTKDVAPFSIVGGIPGKLLKMRFDEDTINYLLKIKWWNKNIDELKSNAEWFVNVEKFKRYINHD